MDEKWLNRVEIGKDVRPKKEAEKLRRDLLQKAEKLRIEMLKHPYDADVVDVLRKQEKSFFSIDNPDTMTRRKMGREGRREWRKQKLLIRDADHKVYLKTAKKMEEDDGKFAELPADIRKSLIERLEKYGTTWDVFPKQATPKRR